MEYLLPDRASAIQFKPRYDTVAMKYMVAGKLSNLFCKFKFIFTYSAIRFLAFYVKYRLVRYNESWVILEAHIFLCHSVVF